MRFFGATLLAALTAAQQTSFMSSSFGFPATMGSNLNYNNYPMATSPQASFGGFPSNYYSPVATSPYTNVGGFSSSYLPAVTSPVVASIGSYPESYSDVRGTVTVTRRDAATLTLTYYLTGLVGESGGLHIHSGTSCQTTDVVGGHFWNTGVMQMDPWSTTWVRDYNGQVYGTFDVISGYTLEQVMSHTVVVHQGSDKVGCGTLTSPYAQNVATYAPSFSNNLNWGTAAGLAAPAVTSNLNWGATAGLAAPVMNYGAAYPTSYPASTLPTNFGSYPALAGFGDPFGSSVRGFGPAPFFDSSYGLPSGAPAYDSFAPTYDSYALTDYNNGASYNPYNNGYGPGLPGGYGPGYTGGYGSGYTSGYGAPPTSYGTPSYGYGAPSYGYSAPYGPSSYGAPSYGYGAPYGYGYRQGSGSDVDYISSRTEFVRATVSDKE